MVFIVFRYFLFQFFWKFFVYYVFFNLFELKLRQNIQLLNIQFISIYMYYLCICVFFFIYLCMYINLYYLIFSIYLVFIRIGFLIYFFKDNFLGFLQVENEFLLVIIMNVIVKKKKYLVQMNWDFCILLFIKCLLLMLEFCFNEQVWILIKFIKVVYEKVMMLLDINNIIRV